MSAARHPIAGLPFVADRPPNDPAGLPRCFWSVKPIGDYEADCRTGNAHALAYLRYLRAEGSRGPGHLSLIVGDMPREITGIEVGFLSIIDHAARTGLPAAELLVAYWEQCRADEEGRRTG
jgi:hypothetical protein